MSEGGFCVSLSTSLYVNCNSFSLHVSIRVFSSSSSLCCFYLCLIFSVSLSPCLLHLSRSFLSCGDLSPPTSSEKKEIGIYSINPSSYSFVSSHSLTFFLSSLCLTSSPWISFSYRRMKGSSTEQYYHNSRISQTLTLIYRRSGFDSNWCLTQLQPYRGARVTALPLFARCNCTIRKYIFCA